MNRVTTSCITFCALATATTAAGHAALPHTEGELSVAGLAGPVTIVRDHLAMPTITSDRFEDVMRGLGFAHAQERFFQMDATRRLAAGELAELVPQMIEMDRQYRPRQFRSVAEAAIERMTPREQRWLAAYTQGVNAGLEQLASLPMEYAAINATPEPWVEADSVLVMLMMFDMLHMEGSFERRMGVMHDALPSELVEFLTPLATRFDVPLTTAGKNDYAPLPIPGPDVVDLRTQANLARDIDADLVLSQPLSTGVPGSNNWAVAGSRTADGRAILANDPHLALMVPPIWYRAHLQWSGDADFPGRGTATGLTLPGVPGIVIGSNSRVAWGFTNVMGDFQDLIIIEVDPDNPEQYRTVDGYEPFEIIEQRINIRGRGWETLELKSTRWGVVTDSDHLGRPLVLKWTALDPDAIDMGIIDMAFASDVEQAAAIAQGWGGPAQNVLIADDAGRIAWAVSGKVPKRFGFDGRYPVSWADGTAGWDGMLDDADKPLVIDPPDGILYTANNRTTDLDLARTMGGIWTAGERAHRIQKLLRDKPLVTELDLLAMQLDTRVAMYDLYRDLALAVMEQAEQEHELYDQARQILLDWNGTADADQPAMRILDMFRHQLHWRIIGALLGPVRELDARFVYRWLMDEEPVRRLLEERPGHLLSPRYATWDDLLEAEWRNTLSRFLALGQSLDTPWGESNRAMIAHPLATAVPMLADRLNLPSDPQPGHPFALRVAMRSFGASARLVVSPGNEGDGILHTPAGQSGHPQSPHYRDGHEYWLHGRPLPLLPGEPNATLVLTPLESPRESPGETPAQ